MLSAVLNSPERPVPSHDLLRVNTALAKGMGGVGTLELDSSLNPAAFPYLAVGFWATCLLQCPNGDDGYNYCIC